MNQFVYAFCFLSFVKPLFYVVSYRALSMLCIVGNLSKFNILRIYLNQKDLGMQILDVLSYLDHDPTLTYCNIQHLHIVIAKLVQKPKLKLQLLAEMIIISLNPPTHPPTYLVKCEGDRIEKNFENKSCLSI